MSDESYGEEAVGLLAAELEISEYEVFALCHRTWFGVGPTGRDLEQAFKGYLLHGSLPYWVRGGARNAARGLREGTFDRRALDLPPAKRPTAALRLRGAAYIGLVAAVMVLIVYICSNY